MSAAVFALLAVVSFIAAACALFYVIAGIDGWWQTRMKP